jgi:hypothetical protein
MDKMKAGDRAEAARRQAEHDDYLAFRASWHNRKLATGVVGLTCTGVRMHPPGDPENGTVVTFSEDEGQAVAKAVEKLLRARLRAEAKPVDDDTTDGAEPLDDAGVN